MKGLGFALCVALLVWPLGCDGDDDAAGGRAGSTGSGGTAGTGASSGAAGGASGNAGTGEGGGQGDDPAAARRMKCEAICATESELECALPETDCIEGWCSEPADLIFGDCLWTLEALLDCAATQPADAFECTEDGPYPKEETCAGEEADFVSCLSG